jgi:ABC-type proline/glycine betaine transport system ATPase subunit
LLLRDIKQLIRAQGMTTVFVTHDLQEAAYLADRIAYMRSGRIEKIVSANTASASGTRPADIDATKSLPHEKKVRRRA